MTVTEKIKYLIIGNSAGGIGAAEAIREVGGPGAVAIVSDEPYPAYSRPLISERLAGGRPVEEMLYRPAGFYEKNDIRLISGERAAAIDTKGKTVTLESGRKLGWQKLLLATGGVPIVPDIPGADLEGVFTFNKIDDADAIDAFIRKYWRKVRAVVIGGGLIGVSVTEALVKRGVDVTMVEMLPRILSAMLDEEASALEAAALEQAGVTVITGHTATAIAGSVAGGVDGVTLDSDRALPADLVIVAVGVRPRLDIVEGSGIKASRGIIVDRRMATSVAGVYACGDAAEAYDFLYGENRVTPVWPNAYTGGRVAGLNMAGQAAEYPGGTSLNAMKYFGVNIVSAGMVTPPDGGYEVISRRSGGNYRKVVLKKGKIAGLVFAGDIEKSGIVYNLMKDGVNVSRFKEALVADDFSLASVPERIWRKRLAVPGSAELPAPEEEPEEAVIGE